MDPQTKPTIDHGGLLSCDREPIHLLGAIQPNGFLLSVGADWFVLRASENVNFYLEVARASVLGRPVTEILSPDVVHDIRGCLQLAAGDGIVGRLFGRRLRSDGAPFDIAVHQSGREFVLEFELSIGKDSGSLSTLRAMIAGIERQSSAQSLYREATRQVRAYTGYDRVMIYRFYDDGAGEVVGECKKGDDLIPFLGLHYPASDIPSQARALYAKNYLRTIADIDAIPVGISPILSPEGVPLDLTMSTLRSVSPIHIEYLRNMGVRSSMSISILRGGRLWGLIACHHGTPRHLSFEMRSTAELFGQMFSHLIDEHQREDDAISDAAAQTMHDRISCAYAGPRAILNNSSEFLASVVDYIPSDGVGIYSMGEIALSGHTPTRDEFLRLVGFLNKATARETFATHELGAIFPPAAAHAMRASGILAIPMTRSPRDYLVFFRREQVSAVSWAGEPAKAETNGPDGPRLSPRKSFAAWREIIKGQSVRWTKRECRAAEALRVTLIELALQTSDSAHVDRTGMGQRQEILIAELNHRVRNILGLVRGLITRSAVSAIDVRTLVESLDDRIRSLASAHDILTSGNWKASSLHDLIQAEIGTYTHTDKSLTLTGPDVMLQPQAYTAMAMVVHELVTNAQKHGALTAAAGVITVSTGVDARNDVVISWRESGGPIVLAPTRRGFGSTILEQAIPFEVNGVSSPRYLKEGFEIDLTLPAAVARCALSRPSPPRDRTRNDTDTGWIDATAMGGLLRTTLLVEDNLFIAVDAEDMLRRLGASDIEIARTVSEALSVLELRTFSFALLDVNLGAETSLPIALALQARKIPFIFGTGYGDSLAMPGTLVDITVVSKPYDRHAMHAALLQLPEYRAGSISVVADMVDAPVASYDAPARRKTIGSATRPKLQLPYRNEQESDVDLAALYVNNPLALRLEKLAQLSSKDKNAFVQLPSDTRFIEAGKDILGKGDRPDGLYIVLDGFACRYALRANGARQITNYLVPGDFLDFSLSGVLKDAMGALSRCEIRHISAEVIVQAARDHASIGEALQRSILLDQSILREWLVDLGGRSAEARFAHLFCEMYYRLDDVGLTDMNSYKFPLTQFDLGDTMGLSYVHVNRSLQSLRQRGLVSLKGKVLTILDLPALAALAGFSPNYLQTLP